MKQILLSFLVTAACLAAPTGPAAADTAPFSVDVRSTPIQRFRIGSDETRFGELEFVGGFEMGSQDGRFGQLSGMRFLTPGERFIGVADHGYWFFGAIERDAEGRPIGMRELSMQPILDASGAAISEKAKADAEGLDVRDGIATVSFEREARVSEYAIDPAAMGKPLRDLDFVIPRNELRFNKGMETVTRAHPYGIHAGGRIVIAERSIDRNGDIFAAILEGPEKGVFKIRRTDEFDITDGVFLEDGDMLILERRFSMAQGVAVRIRRIYGEPILKGGLVDGPVLMQADLGHQIDNLEAMDVWKRDDGATIVSLMSDDNQSFLQRSLYLEFRLAE